MAQPAPYQTVQRTGWRNGEARTDDRAVPEETAVAFSYNRLSFAVMMATPADLEDFAVGFSLSEQVVAAPQEIEDLQIVMTSSGIELRMWIGEAHKAALP